MKVISLLDEAIKKFEAEHGVVPNVIFLGRCEVAALNTLQSGYPGGSASITEGVSRPNYNDIAIEEVDADSHLSVDRLKGNEWPTRG